MQATKISFGTVIANFAEAVRSRPILICVTIVLIAAAYESFDLINGAQLNFIPSLAVSIVGQYLFIEKLLLDDSHRGTPHKRRYGSLFSAGLLSGMGIIIGLLLLILPGIFLISRWSASSAYVVADDMSGSEALRASWDATEEARWPIFSVYLLGSLFFCVLISISVFGRGFTMFPGGGLVASIISNLVVGVLTVGGWTLGVAVFRSISPISNRLEEVFA